MSAVIDILNTTVNEGDGYVDVTLSLSAPSAQQVQVTYNTSSGTAGSGDYQGFFNGLVTFAPGETSKAVRVAITNDTAAESTESFYVLLSTPVNAVLGNSNAIVNIYDNDGTSGTPTASVSDTLADEKDGMAQFVIQLDKPSSQVVSFAYTTAGDTAASGADFTAQSGSVTFQPGQTVQTVSVLITDDVVAEPTERFTLVLSNPQGAGLAKAVGSALIMANDASAVATPVIDILNTTVNEGDGYVDVTLSLSAPSAQQVQVTYNTSSGTAGSGDYQGFFNGLVTFAPGETSKAVRVAITNDTAAESTESFYVLLSTPVNAVLGNSNAIVNIYDNDGTSGTPTASVSDTLADEKDGMAQFVIQLDKPSSQVVSFAYTTAGDTAASGADFTAQSGSVTFQPGQTVQTVSVLITDDVVAEPTERFTLVLSNPQGAGLAKAVGSALIMANDASAVATPVIDILNTTVNEGDGYVDVTLSLSAPSAQQVQVTYNTSSGTAGSGDYQGFFNGLVTFAPGETSKAVRVAITNDTAAESTESFYVLLSTPVNAVLGNSNAIVNIYDNDGTSGTPTASVSDTLADEKDGMAQFVIQLDKPSSQVVSFAYTTAGDTAASGADFTAQSGSVTFQPGQTVQTVSVLITDDVVAEPTERFTLVLSNPQGAGLAKAVGSALIMANDASAVATPVIDILNTTVNEGDGYVDVTLSLSAPSAQQVQVTYNTSSGTAGSGDYQGFFNGLVTFAPGETSKAVRVAITNDTAAESTESFYVLLSTPVNAVLGNSNAIVNIYDNDGTSGTPTASVSDTLADEKDGMAQFVIQLDKPSSQVVSFAYTTAGDTAASGADFTAQSGSVTFQPGQTVQTVSVLITDDVVAEPTERFTLVLSNPQGAGLAKAVGSALIMANDASAVATPVIDILNTTVNEGDGYVDVTLSLSAPSAQQVQVTYNTSSGTAGSGDYQGFFNGLVTFAAGETSKAVRVAITNDTTVEGTEAFTLKLSAPVNATIGNATATVTIAERDGGPSVAFTGDSMAPVNAAIDIAVWFGQSVTGLSADDFIVQYGHVLSFAGSDTAYTVRVEPNADYEGSLYLTVKPDAAVNGSGIGNEALTVAQAIDTLAPSVSFFSPADATMGVHVASNIVLTFSESIARGTGNILLKTATGATLATYDVATSTNLSIAGGELTVHTGTNLVNGTHYVVEFAAGSIKDLAGNPYAGSASYDFTTVAGVVGGFTGTPGDDHLQGTGGNDSFTTGMGDDTVDGGFGVDTVALPMFPNVFSLTQGGPGHVAGAYAGNTLVLNDVEFVQFGADFQTTLPLSSLLSGDAQLQLGRLTDLYLAFFGRAPDTSGLEYWQEQLLEKGRDFSAISKDFAWSPEAQALFPQNGSNRDFVQTVYVNSFGRQPDAGGWDYWTGRLNGLGVTDLNDRGAFVGEVILGAYAPSSGAEDRALLTNRHEAAMYYVNQLSKAPAEGFDTAINTLLAKVTGDAGTEVKAEHVIDYAFSHPITLTGVMTDAALLGSIWAA